jgi:hypothetical protein
MAPINAEDYGSGDLDKHFARMTSLRIDTSKPTGMASRALEALGIADDDLLKDADDGGKEDLFEVRRPSTPCSCPSSPCAQGLESAAHTGARLGRRQGLPQQAQAQSGVSAQRCLCRSCRHHGQLCEHPDN